MTVQSAETAGPGAERSGEVWQGLVSKRPEIFLPAWFQLTLAHMGEASRAVLFAAPQSGERLQLFASRGIDELQLAPYLRLLGNPEARRRADIHTLESDTSQRVLCYPIEVAGGFEAAFICEADADNPEALQTMLRQLQWGIGHLEAFFSRRALVAQEGRAARVFSSLELALTTLEQQSLRDASRALATEVAVKLDARRVSLGVMENSICRVVAVSHAASFVEESNDVRAIAAAMDEAIDQKNLVLTPNHLGRDSAVLSWANAELLQRSDSQQIATIPFTHGDDFRGALVAEWESPGDLDGDRLAVLEAVTAMLAPVLALYCLNDRGPLQRLRDSLQRSVGWLLGPRGILAKALLLSLAVAVVVSVFYRVPFRLSADVVLEGQVLRAAVAPFDGYISESARRAGDIVEAGEMLAALDDTDLTLELNKWRAKRQQQLRRLREARAGKNSAEMLVAEDQISEATAEIDLLESRLERTRIVAPFAGYVVSGDLSDSLEAPVRRGDVLFEIAPLSEFRINLRVDERDIRHLSLGDEGELLLRGLTLAALPIEITRITPVAEVIDGTNAFEVEAAFVGPVESAMMLPGMEGVARVNVGEASLLWVLTRRLTGWARLAFWSYVP